MNKTTDTQIEFTLTQDGHLTVKHCGDDQIIYELTRTAREQAAAYRKSQQDPIALLLVGIAISILGALTAQVIVRPAPQYLPQTHETSYRP